MGAVLRLGEFWGLCSPWVGWVCLVGFREEQGILSTCAPCACPGPRLLHALPHRPQEHSLATGRGC
jgi:hypothetical protein